MSNLLGKELFFPDSNFRYMLVLKYGFLEHNGDINPSNATNSHKFETTTELNLAMCEIETIKGIEYFTNLIILNISLNSIWSIDLSQNRVLESLDYSDNSISDANTEIKQTFRPQTILFKYV